MITLLPLAPLPNLKLEPAYSRVKPGGFVEVDCVSPFGHNVRWEGVNGEALPYNFEVRFLFFCKMKIINYLHLAIWNSSHNLKCSSG